MSKRFEVIKLLAEGFAEIIGALKTRVSAVEARLGDTAALQARIAALEKRPGMSYRGVWAAGEGSQPGDVCTHDGSMWYCWAATKDRPGTSDAWQLCVKRGRDLR
jgi:hypothetical protein